MYMYAYIHIYNFIYLNDLVRQFSSWTAFHTRNSRRGNEKDKTKILNK